MKHQNSALSFRHPPYNWVWVNAAARLIEEVEITDLYKTGLQLDVGIAYTLAEINTDDTGIWIPTHGLGADNVLFSGPTQQRTFELPDEDAIIFTSKTPGTTLQAALHGLDVTDTDSTADYDVQLFPAITGYTVGTKFRFKAASTNAGACTVSLSELADTSIKKMVGGVLSELAAADIRVDQWVELIYDGTDMIVVSPLGNTLASGAFATAAQGTLADSAIQPQLVENAPILFDAAASADGKYSGFAMAGTAGATLAFGDLCYFAVADSRWELADANAAATAGGVMLGICVLAAAADGDPTRMILIGTVRADAKFPALTVGAPAYVGTGAGEIQVAQPSGADDVIRIVGHARTADELFFNPSPDWMEHT